MNKLLNMNLTEVSSYRLLIYSSSFGLGMAVLSNGMFLLLNFFIIGKLLRHYKRKQNGLDASLVTISHWRKSDIFLFSASAASTLLQVILVIICYAAIAGLPFNPWVFMTLMASISIVNYVVFGVYICFQNGDSSVPVPLSYIPGTGESSYSHASVTVSNPPSGAGESSNSSVPVRQ